MGCYAERMSISVLCLVVAAVLFLMGAWSRWWPASGNPYHPALISLGLFFAVLAQLLPLLK